jgi:luxR family response regulator
VVVDDHPVVRSGIVGMFSSEADLAVVGEAADGAQAVALVAELAPDVVLMDLRMPGLDGVEAIRRISAGAGTAHSAAGAGAAAHAPAPRIVVLTTYDTDGDILRAVEAGAIGYLLKDSAREDILAAVRAAAVGRSALSPTVTTRLLGAARGAGQSAAGAPRGARVPVSLSPREREVLAAVSRGLSNSQIGVELYITEATVKTHLLRAYAKLGVDSRAAAVTEALRRGLLELE